MRNMARNERQMWYALYAGKEMPVDDNGDKTGDQVLKYSKPVEFWAVMSPGRGYNAGFAGTLRKSIFGIDIDTERRIMTTDLSLPVTETSLIWIHKPEVLSDGSADPNTADFAVTARPTDGKTFLAIPFKARLENA